MVARPVASARDFPGAYSLALATQNWASVAPLIHPDACVTFSSGEQHRGIAAVESAYRRNFSLIQSESYRVSNLHWTKVSGDYAVYTFRFDWSGVIHGKLASGCGTGTAILIRTDMGWQLLAEHLGPAPSAA